MPFRKNGLVLRRQGIALISNLQSLNADLSGALFTSASDSLCVSVSRHTLNAFYWQLSDALKQDYPPSQDMVQKFADDNLRILVERGGRIHYTFIQSWVHRYFYPV